MERFDPRSAGLTLQTDPSRYTLPRFLEDVARRHTGRPAIHFAGTESSYAEIERDVLRLSRALVAAGVVKGARVAILMANRPQWVTSMFAATMVGAVVVPVSTFATVAEREYILRHSDASVLLLQPEILKRRFLDELSATYPEVRDGEPGRLRCRRLPCLRRVVTLGSERDARGIETWDSLLASAADVPEDLVGAIAAEVTPYDEALIIYTSGTTDRPKGIVHAHRAPVIQSWRFAELMGLRPDDRVWTAQPFFWTAGVAMSLGATWAAGGCLLIQESFEPGAAIDLIARERATAVHAWPHQEKAMAEHPEARRRDLTSVRRIEFGSPLAQLVGLERDEWGMYASYGLSETFTLASALPATAPAAERASSSGRPLPGIELRIVDPASGRELAEDEFGEIAVRGLTMMRGYYKFEPELYMAEDGFYRTGDSGRVDRDGDLHWTGRLSSLIKTGGANVSPLEIESTLSEYPGIKASCALGVPHPTLGEAVVLCVIPIGGVTPDLDAIRTHLRAKLASYKLPKALLVFPDEEVQYTGNQKIQPAPLRAAALGRLERERVTIDGHRYGD